MKTIKNQRFLVPRKFKEFSLEIMIFLLISIFFVSACAQQKPEDLVGGGTPVPQQEQPSTNQVSQQNTQAAATAATAASSSGNNVKEFKITAKQFQFEPSTIEVNKGDKVRLVITSIDVPHGFAIPEYGINQRLDPGKPATIEFTADKEGTFTTFCSVFCGSGHINMKGKLVVK
ncbi:cupredoxin domain-containing protein [Candidatus Woesearchaeota archaeon]|nr:cupredoxin domain-containing protein [Candidatus Woesearchaeota archaeon]